MTLPLCENTGWLPPWLICLSASLVHQPVSWQHSLVSYCAQGTAAGDQGGGKDVDKLSPGAQGSELATLMNETLGAPAPNVIKCPFYIKGQLQGVPKVVMGDLGLLKYNRNGRSQTDLGSNLDFAFY